MRRKLFIHIFFDDLPFTESWMAAAIKRLLGSVISGRQLMFLTKAETAGFSVRRGLCPKVSFNLLSFILFVFVLFSFRENKIIV